MPVDEALSAARASGARVAVIGGAPYGVYPAGAAGAPRASGRDFAPRVALLLGDDTARLAVGSRGDDALWTTVACTGGASHAMLADLADWFESLSAAVDFAPWAEAHLRALADAVAERHIGAPVGPDDETRLVHNLDVPLLNHLPTGAVDELQVHAPVLDPDARALRAIVDRFAPGHVTLVLPPPRVGYDPNAVAAALAGHPAEIRIADDADVRGGRLIQWQTGGRWTVLAGGAELTWRALGLAVASGGVPELAALGAGDPALLPARGTRIPYESGTAAVAAPAATEARDPDAVPSSEPASVRADEPPGLRPDARPRPVSPPPAPAAPVPPAPVPPAAAVREPVVEAAPPRAGIGAPDHDLAASAEPPSAAWADNDPGDETPEFEGPFAEVLSQLAASGWTADEQDGIWEVTGSFANPLPIAAQAVDGFAQVQDGIVFVRAASKGRWVFVGWDGRHVVMLKHDQPVWRTYRVDAPATPGSRFSGGSVAVPGLLATTPQVKGAPPVLAAMLGELGWDYPELIKRLFVE
ncbi:hypothetical protein LO772_26690 [Yinghuangia sp. ASG 101]|uniref:hypothetical protein n=1 Tax=Yinghuangia sp. ASG 101 TaxID=2896848 RepID=UPI001E3BE336|nr:hypothetical protein [Yinghuangia sp. ASG 101]UGQ10410.1 hypothetical protein LO772_26690 [Yinghuangia sp. ASG 101]